MFTGLIKTQGTIRRIDQRGDRIMTIAMNEPFPVEVGDSIACHGICLTAIKVSDIDFKVSLSEETLSCSTADDWHTGTVINLEPALRVGDKLGGHFVSGHVDGVGKVRRAEKIGDSTLWEFEVPPALAKLPPKARSPLMAYRSPSTNRTAAAVRWLSMAPSPRCRLISWSTPASR